MNKDFSINIDDYNESCKDAIDSVESLISQGVTTKELLCAIKITHEIVTDCFEMNMKYGKGVKENE